MPSLPRSLYVHVPFCRDICSYCDFCKLIYREPWAREYIPALFDEIDSFGIIPNSLETLYVGGGTPTSLADPLFSSLLQRLAPLLGPGGEFTVEANPDSLSKEKVAIMARNGVNRVSLGVQTFSPRLLALLRRHHTPENVRECLQMLARAGIANVNVDFMYALPGETPEEFERDLLAFSGLGVPHISTYSLILESGSILGVRGYQEASQDVQADMYLDACEILRSYGFEHYEISNFAKRGFASKHNLKYWTGGEYLGFGPTAASDFDGKRFTAIRDLRGYIQGIAKHGQILSELEHVPTRERAGEYIMLRLRTSEGISAEEYERSYLMPFDTLGQALERFRANGYAEFVKDRWRLTEKGWLVSNRIILVLQELQERSTPLTKKR